MKQPFPIAATIFAGGALLLSLVMLPGDNEMGAMDLRDQSYDGAVASYEAAAVRGDRSKTTLALLARAYAGSGEIDKSIAVYHDFLRQEPDHLEAKLALLEAYRDGQRIDDYYRLLKDITLDSDDTARLRTLSEEAALRHDLPVEEQALTALSAKGAAEPDDLRRLAFLLARNERYKDAARVLDQIPDRSRTAQQVIEDSRFAFRLALDAGDPNRAEAIASRALHRRDDFSAAGGFIEALSGYGYQDAAIRVIARLDPGGDPALRLQRASLKLSVGDRAGAAEEARAIYDAAPNDVIRREAAGLLSDTGDQNALAALTADGGFAALSPDRQLAVIDAHLDAGNIDAAKAAMNSAGPGFIDRKPVLAARVALASGAKKDARRIIANALGRAETSGTEIIELAILAEAAGDSASARRAAAKFPPPASANAAQLEAMARFYVRFGQAKAKLPAFASLRQAAPGPAVDRAWVRLATAAGDLKSVSAWLKQAGDVPAAVLYDIADTAIKRRAYPLARAAGERIAAAAPTRQNKSYLAYIRHKTGDHRATLALLGEIKPLNRNERDLYAAAALASGDQRLVAQTLGRDLKRGGRAATQALHGLIAAGAFAAAEPEIARRIQAGETDWLYSYGAAAKKKGQTKRFVAFVQANAFNPGAPAAVAEAGISSVAEAAGQDAALDLRRLAAERFGGEWAEAYEFALIEAGRKDAATASRVRRATSGALPKQKRIALADALAADGRKREAEAIYRQLAERAGARSVAVERLLYLWGPRPSADAKAWLALRARQAKAPEARRLWRRHMISFGAGDDVFRQIVAAPSAADPADMRMAAEIAPSMRDKRAAAVGVAGLIAVARDTGALVALSNTSETLGDKHSAYAAIVRAAQTAPDNPNVLRRAGYLGLSLGRPNEAYAVLSRYIAIRPADASAAMDFAAAADRLGRYSEAAEAYGRAALIFRRTRQDEAPARLAEAYALQKAGKKNDAIATLAGLAESRPRDARARAAYVAALLDAGRAEEAKRALNR